MQSLSDTARAIVAEEEALLVHVLAALRARPEKAKSTDRAQLAQQLRALQEEASSAVARDLPSLFQQMTSVRALLEREKSDTEVDEDTPYFAHLRLRTKKGARDYVLGRSTFIDTQAQVRLIDWRFAPIARIFYTHQEGDDFEQTLPSGEVEGVVEVRRVLVIEKGELTRILAGPLSLVREDGEWKESGASGVLAGGAGSAARPGVLGVGAEATRKRTKADITSLLDAEQFEAVHAPADESLLVLGSAGSGKTTVALHRLSRLAFSEPERFPSHRLQVVVPEEGLARLSRRLLEPLGLGSVSVKTLDDWLYRIALDTFALPKIRLAPETPASLVLLKRHPALVEALKKAIGPELAALPFKELRRKLHETFADRAFVASVVENAGGELPLAAVDDAARHSMLQLESRLDVQYAGYDAESLRTVDGGSIAERTSADIAGTVDAEDLPLLLYLRLQGASLVLDSLSHALIDEAEDFSLFELAILRAQLDEDASCTLAGDDMQQTTSGFAGWGALLNAVGAPKARRCRLQVSYRCPKPITLLAQQVLGSQAPADAAQSGREGVPVGRHVFPEEAQTELFLADALRQLLDRELDASVGVIASTSEQARRLHEALADLHSVRLVTNGEFSFEPGVDITDVDNVKGLEFDYVILPDATARAYPDTPDSRRRLHVAVTRASHQLWLMATGRMTPLVPNV